MLIVVFLLFLYLVFSFSDDDSGIFAMKNLELYEANADLLAKYTEADIAHLLIKYVNEMIWNEHNIANDGRANVEQYDAEVILVSISLFCVLLHLAFELIVVSNIFPSGL